MSAPFRAQKHARRQKKGQINLQSTWKNVLIPVVLVVATALFVWLVGFDQIKALVSVSAILSRSAQSEAMADMESHSKAIFDGEPQISTNNGTGVLASYPRHGEMIGTLEAPTAGISVAVYQGDDYDILAKGAGHLFSSALPGENSKVVLSTHNNTFFSTLDQLVVGDEVTLDLYYGTYRYRVSETYLFDENDTAQLAGSDTDELFCYTCYPLNYLGATPQRYAVVCTLVEGASVTWE